ncbi:MAG: NYN domain-containing protein [Nanoarchaeota archaeon]|nr:NYN domain-containing protein [Nanoarchaeota archaeon]
MIKRVSVYIDGANFYYELKTINIKYSDIFFDFEKFVKEIIRNDELIAIYYYNAPLKENLNKWVYWNQMSLFVRLRKIVKCKVILCKRQKRIDRDEKEYYVIKGDDIHLSLDMLRDACKDKYDKAILISGDGDFTQLVEYVKEENKEVIIYAFKELTSVDLINKSNKHFWIDKKIVNKFFWRGKAKIS